MIYLTKKVDDDTIIGFYFLGCVGQSNLIHVRIIYHANETLRRVALCCVSAVHMCAWWNCLTTKRRVSAFKSQDMCQSNCLTFYLLLHCKIKCLYRSAFINQIQSLKILDFFRAKIVFNCIDFFTKVKRYISYCIVCFFTAANHLAVSGQGESVVANGDGGGVNGDGGEQEVMDNLMSDIQSGFVQRRLPDGGFKQQYSPMVMRKFKRSVEHPPSGKPGSVQILARPNR